MKSIKALIQNEFIKIFTRRSVFVLLIILVLLTIFVGGMYKLLYTFGTDFILDNQYGTEWIGADVQDYKKDYDKADDVDSKLQAALSLATAEAANEMVSSDDEKVPAYKLSLFGQALDYRTASIFQNYYSSIMREYGLDYSARYDEYSYYLELDSTYGSKLIADYNAIKSYDDYLKYVSSGISSTRLSENQIKIEKQMLSYMKLAGDEGEDTVVMSYIQAYKVYAYSIEDGIDYQSGGDLSFDTKKKYEKELEIIDKRITGGYIYTENSNYGAITSDVMMSVSMFFSTIIIIVIAGGCISGEIATGSVKSLIITPIKRGKIINAKILTLFIAGFALTVLSYIVTVLGTMIYYGGFAGFETYITDNLIAIPSLVYLFLRFLISFVDLLVFALFAVMLSTVTKNSALSIALTVVLYAVGGDITSIINLFQGHIPRSIYYVLPYNNLSLTNAFFPDSVINFGKDLSNGYLPSLLFSVIYVAILGTALFLTAHDSFERKDIL